MYTCMARSFSPGEQPSTQAYLRVTTGEQSLPATRHYTPLISKESIAHHMCAHFSSEEQLSKCLGDERGGYLKQCSNTH